jgi:phosphatidylserine decarboxylase
VRDGLVLNLLSVVPRSAVSRAMGVFGRSKLPRFLLRPLLSIYCRIYGVNLGEAARALPEYDSFVDFFTRELRDGLRPLADAPLISPADGAVASFGRVVDGTFPGADGLDARMADLLGGDGDGGSFIVIYLSPKDYHRVHSPVAGALKRWRYLPGKFWPVFPASTRAFRDLFATNERLAVEIETAAGPLWLVFVAAFGVGRIATTFCEPVSNAGFPKSDGVAEGSVSAGDELGRFELGSTVVIVAPGEVDWCVEPGQPIKLGEALAR